VGYTPSSAQPWAPARDNLLPLIGFLRTILRRDPPLVRTRSTGRPRTYSADSGYVYQYSFAGFRRIKRGGEGYIEYVFEVTGARETPSAVSVLLAEGRLPEWTGTQRELTASERYGIAKLCLKRALDSFPDPKSLKPQVLPDKMDIEEVAATLDL
jgi:hypothetical protein